MSEEKSLAEKIAELKAPFHPRHVYFKPGRVSGQRGLALAYVDLRAYQERLDEVFGVDWSISYQPWGNDKLIATLQLGSFTPSSTVVERSAVGESSDGENSGTVAEAQAFKRACAQFGLGRYLYSLPQTWADFDPTKKQFTPTAKGKLTAQIVQLYRQVTGKTDADDLAVGDPWHDGWGDDDGQTVGRSDGQAPAASPHVAASQPEDESDIMDTILSHVKKLQAQGGRPASEAQMKKLINTLTWVCGKASNGAAAVELLLGSRDLPMMSVASYLIDLLDSTKWNRDTQQAEPNPNYKKEAADAVKAYYLASD